MTIRKNIVAVTKAVSAVAALCSVAILSLTSTTRAADPIRPTKVWPTEVSPTNVQPATVTPPTPVDTSQPDPPTPFAPASPNPVPLTADIPVPGPRANSSARAYVQWRNLGTPPEVAIAEEPNPQPEPGARKPSIIA